MIKFMLSKTLLTSELLSSDDFRLEESEPSPSDLSLFVDVRLGALSVDSFKFKNSQQYFLNKLKTSQTFVDEKNKQNVKT